MFRDIKTDLKVKNKHPRENLSFNPTKKTKHPKLGNYMVTSTKA